jgi:hypothetical protein
MNATFFYQLCISHSYNNDKWQLWHYETGFGVYCFAQLTPHSFFLLLYLFIGPTLDKNVKFNFNATFINIVYANRTTL